MKKIITRAVKTIEIGRSCSVSRAKELIEMNQKSSCILIISDREVAGYYLSAFNEMLVSLNKNVEYVVIEPGAQMKSLESLKPIFEKLIDLEMKENDYVLILGGGSVIDIALFAISIYTVSLHTIIFPTTLFSMIETGLTESAHINFQGHKDLLCTQRVKGSVVIDTDYLSTVPPKIITNGSAQIVQYGLLINSGLLTLLSAPKNMEQIIENSIITGQKIRDKEPKWLDFGRDIGDAIEMHFRYYNYTSGEALALGLFAVCPSKKLKKLYERLDLPTLVEGVTRDTLMKRIEKSMRKTKKGVQIVNIDADGRPLIVDYNIDEALAYYNKVLNLICNTH